MVQYECTQWIYVKKRLLPISKNSFFGTSAKCCIRSIVDVLKDATLKSFHVR